MTASRLKPFVSIDAHMLKQELDRQSITLIDVREPGEYWQEHISGATLVSLSQFDSHKIPQGNDMQIVLYCRSGNRSAIAAQKLFEAGFERVSQLAYGIEAWKDAGYPTISSQNAPIGLMRQVQIVAGMFVLMGTILGAWVSPWFLLVTGFVGTGLMFSGVTNTCLLGMLLARLPYNQRNQP